MAVRQLSRRQSSPSPDRCLGRYSRPIKIKLNRQSALLMLIRTLDVPGGFTGCLNGR